MPKADIGNLMVQFSRPEANNWEIIIKIWMGIRDPSCFQVAPVFIQIHLISIG